MHYSGYEFFNTIMVDGDGFPWSTTIGKIATNMPTWDGSTTMVGNANNGYAKVTLLSSSSVEEVIVKNATVVPSNNDSSLYEYDVFIDDLIFDTFVDVKFLTNFSYVTGIGDVTLKVGEKHYISAIDKSGEVAIIALNVLLKPLDVTIEFDEVEYVFDKNVLNQTLNVNYNVRNLTPIIKVGDGISYEIKGFDNLKIGKNKATVKFSQGTKEITYYFNIIREEKIIVDEGFLYTGGYQEYIVPETADYVIELWGASGSKTAYGGYTKGSIHLEKGTKLYFYLGQKSVVDSNASGFNAGTGSSTGYSGGGATDVRLVASSNWRDFESLKSRIMVAAGGGTAQNGTPGAAGGLVGYDGGGTKGATQTSASAGERTEYGTGAFGIADGGTAGGSGYYGAGGANFVSGSGGGSSFISGHNGCDAISESSTSTNIIHTGQSVHYSGYQFYDTVMIDGMGYSWTNVKGSKVNMPTYDHTTTIVGNGTHGYARIYTLLETSSDNTLKSLTITDLFGKSLIDDEGNEIVFDFDSSVREYNISLHEDVTEMLIEAIPNDLDALVLGDGKIDVASGVHDVKIIVTAPNGLVNEYVIHVTRAASTNPFLKGFKINGVVYPEFKEGQFDYEIVLPYEQSVVLVEGIKENPKQTIAGEGVQVLVNNEATAELLVVSEDTHNNKYYQIHFTKEKTTLLDTITFNEISKSIKLEKNKFEYEIDATIMNHSLTLDIVPFYEGVNLVVEGNKYIGEDSKKIVVTSSLEGEKSSVYTFNINYKTDAAVDPQTYDYPYTGNYQTFVVPESTYYEIELWGATGTGQAYGGYTRGKIFLEKGTEIYIYVGQKVQIGDNTSGFNSGTGTSTGYSGGGATDIRLIENNNWRDFESLKSRIMVAAGGGTAKGGNPGAAGGLVGYDGGGTKGATQVSASLSQPGYPAAGFGFSAGGTNGGNGYYAAGGGNFVHGAGGGSSFISGHDGCNAIEEASTSNRIIHSNQSIHYSGKRFINTIMIDGKGYGWTTEKTDLQLMPNPQGNYFASGTGNNNDGYARIKTAELIPNDNYLDSLEVKVGEEAILLEPEFAPWNTEYTINLTKDQNKVNINATPKDLKAIVDGTGVFEIEPGESILEIVVTAQDLSTKTYTLNFVREKDNDSYPNTIKVNRMPAYLCKINSSYCIYEFNKTTTEYTINLPYSIKEIELFVDKKSKWQTVNFYQDYDFDNPSVNVPIESNGVFELVNSNTTIYIEVISEDEKENVIYTYNFLKDATGNNNLESITITNPDVLIPDFDPYTYEYYLTLPTGYQFDLEAVPERKENTQVKIENTTLTSAPYKETITGLIQGMNNVKIIVTSENGDTKTYVLHVYKGYESDVLLKSLTITNDSNNLELTPDFDGRLNDYSLRVGSDISTINIGAIANDTVNTTVSGIGLKTLKSGINEFKIEVKSKKLNALSKYDTNTYNLTIYKDMSDNANISNITVDGYTLDPIYNKDIKEYYIYLNSGDTSVNVNVLMEDALATYTVRGNNNLNKAVNEIVITGIAEDKSYVVYKIYAYKNISDNNYLSSLSYKVADDFVSVPNFVKTNLKYTVNVSSDTRKIEIDGVAEDKNSLVSGKGIYYLNTGSNIINIVVTSESGNVNTYVIDVIREKNDDVSLKEVVNNQGSEVIKSNNPEIDGYDYLINVQYIINTITITGLPNVDTSTVSGNGTYNLSVGSDNNIVLNVTSEAGNSKDYIVKVVRDLSNNDDLEFLYVQEGGLNPKFNPTTIVYEVKVPDTTDVLHIEAITEDINATYEVVGGTKNNLGIYEVDFSDVSVGETKDVMVVVTAQNNKDKKSYIISVTKQASTEENLSLEGLQTDRGELIPTFSPDELNYELTVTNDIEDITISATAFSSDVNIIGLGKYNLNVGKNGISIFVVGTDGVQRDYQIVVTREKSSDATLNSLVVKGHVISPIFSSNNENYTLNTSKEYLEFTTIKPTESEATYVIEGNTSFVTGNNEVKIVVTAPDGRTTKTYTITAVKAGSINNNLATLEVEGYQLVPVFHKGVTFYAVDIPNSVNSIMIKASAEDSNAEIGGTGLKKVVTGENYFDVVVTSEAGSKKTYTILVTKDPSSNNYLGTLYSSEGILDPEFDKTNNSYTITVGHEVSEIEIYGSTEDAHAIVNGFKKYELNVGSNNIDITVTSEDGTPNVYTINVIREEVKSAYLSNIDIGSEILDPEFNKEIFEYFVTVNNEVTKLDLTYTLEDANAVATITGNDNFVVGMNEIHINVIRVVDENETLEQEYVIYVNRQMSSNNYLESLYLSDGTLVPEFNKETLTYEVNVGSDVEEVTVYAKTEDSTSKILSGTGLKTLDYGLNVITVGVRSSIGVVRTYTINILREKSTNNSLLDLKVKSIDGNVLGANEEFKTEVVNYQYDLTASLSYVNIEVIKGDNYQIVSGTGVKELTSGENIFEIIVTAQDGSINTYKVTINNPLSNNNYATMIKPSSGELAPAFSKEVTNYTLEVEDVSSLYFEVTLENNKATVSGHKIQLLDEGVSTRVITVTAEDGTTREYTITIERPSKSNALLESLEIEGYPIEFDPNTFVYNISVSKSKKELLESEIKAIPKDSEATVNLMGDIILGEDIINVYTIEVIAKDGYTTEEYTLNITRDSEEYTIRSEVYDIRREEVEFPYVIGIEPDTNMSIFKDNFLNDNELLKLYDKNNQLIEEDSKLVGTAMTLKLEKDGYVYDEVKVIVRGDLNYDGKVNGADQLTMDNFIVKIVKFDGYQQLAADITKDGKVNGADQLSMDNYIVKILKKLN